LNGRVYKEYNLDTPEQVGSLLEHDFRGHLDIEIVYEQCVDTMPQLVEGCDLGS
jgi:hypothetical protein